MRLKRTAKKVINRVVKPWGMELAYTHVLTRTELRRDWLRRFPIRTVLDIGANVGQFASQIREVFPEAFIYSFEPLRDAHRSLVSEMRGDKRFRAFNFALGAENSRVIIHRSGSSASSSLRPMLDTHVAVWPSTAETGTEEVEVRQLDSLDLELAPDLLVKIDVQGFEDKVIEGGLKTLSTADFVIAEVSFIPLYEGQPLFEQIYELLSAIGFAYRGNLSQLTDPRDDRPLQADAFFVREATHLAATKTAPDIIG